MGVLCTINELWSGYFYKFTSDFLQDENSGCERDNLPGVAKASVKLSQRQGFVIGLTLHFDMWMKSCNFQASI